MAKRRVKSAKPAIIPIESWQQADDILRKLGDSQLAINRAEALAKTRIDDAKKQLAVEVAPQQEQIDICVRSLEAFCSAHKDSFRRAKSRQMNFGVVGWRKSTSIRTKKTTLELIKEFFTPSKKKACIRIKETVDKEALSKLTDEELVSVDARREVKDDFYAEPDLPEAVDYE